MKNFFSCLLLMAIAFGACSQNSCAIKFGSCRFINCQHLVVVQGEDLFMMGKWEGASPEISFAIYETGGKPAAQIVNGKITEGAAANYKIVSGTDEFSVMDARTQRIIFLMKKVKPEKDDVSCQINVSADLIMKNGEVFICSPVETNLAVMKSMGGATFKNGGTCFTVN